MKRKKLKNVKKNVLPHSQAKLDLYKTYLKTYFAVLGNVPFVKQINIYDVFCGTGIYEDGKIGSPIIAFDCIKENRNYQLSKNITQKPVTLTVNDGKKANIDKVKDYINSQNHGICTPLFFNLPAEDMFSYVQKKVNSSQKSEKNLVFIDPYGYKDIHKIDLFNLLKNELTEIILFLPTAQMYRFSDFAQGETDAAFIPLRNFINEFFEEEHPMRTGTVETIFSYIENIKQAFSFNDRFFTSSHYIQRDKSNYFAVFFITSNIYGLDRMLEAKWRQDPISGKGTKLRGGQLDAFEEHYNQEDKKLTLEWLQEIMRNLIKEDHKVTNLEMYEFVLKNQFKATFAVDILTEWQKSGYLVVHNFANDEKYKNGAFFLNYDNYKTRIPKVYFKLK